MTVVSTGNEIPMFGVAGRSVRLPCNIPIADRPIVEWSDMVWTSDGKPSLIFRSERNPEFEVHASHQNAINYVIDNDFALTIDGLDMDADPGQYTCRSVVNGGRVFERHYYLTVGELPTCSGDVDLSEGQSTTLDCQMTYSGQQPLLQWFRSGHLVQSDDEYDIRLAKKVVSLEATETDDKAEYACRMSLGDVTKECSLVLNVTYLVRDIKFLPTKEKFRVGDELKCSAKGNPVPRISLLANNIAGARTGPASQSLIIGQKWEGQRVTVQCIASNAIGNDAETVSTNLTIHVTAPKRPTTAFIPQEEEHQTIYSARQTPPPTVMRRDHTPRPGGGHQRKQHLMTTVSGRNAGIGSGKQLVQEADIEQHDSNRNTVTYQVNDERTDRPFIKTMDAAKDRGATKEDSPPDIARAKPAQSKSNRAGQIKHRSYRTVLTVVLVVVLSRTLLN